MNIGGEGVEGWGQGRVKVYVHLVLKNGSKKAKQDESKINFLKTIKTDVK